MIARKYSRKIQIYNTTSTPDNFGGNTIALVLIGSFWAEVKQLASNKDNSVGTAEIKTTYSFRIRNNSDKINTSLIQSDLSIVYRGNTYVVNEITYDDELFRFVKIVAHG